MLKLSTNCFSMLFCDMDISDIRAVPGPKMPGYEKFEYVSNEVGCSKSANFFFFSETLCIQLENTGLPMKYPYYSCYQFCNIMHCQFSIQNSLVLKQVCVSVILI